MTSQSNPENQFSGKPREVEAIDKMANSIAKVTNRVLNAMEEEDSQSGIEDKGFDTELEKTRKAQFERRTILETNHEQYKQTIINKWKRY